MKTETRTLIEQIHAAAGQVALVVAGAGTQAVRDLLAVAGASNTLLEATIPYSRAAFIDYLGAEPRKFVSQQAGMRLAGRAFARAAQLADHTQIVGVSCTATIATNRPKKGMHHAHISSWSRQRVVTYSLILEKGARTREEEEAVISHLLLNAVATALGVPTIQTSSLTANDQLTTSAHNFSEATAKLLANEIDYYAVHRYGRVRFKGVNPQLLLSGSFNPLHEGHLAMARAATAQLGQPVAFELAAFNVDKPALASDTILERLTQFAGRWPIYITNRPTFIEKARIFNNTTFVVGYDTAARILEPRYYDNSEVQMQLALDELAACGCQFLVAGRVDKNGMFKTAEALNIPLGYEELFIPLHNFRLDISSTEIRNRAFIHDKTQA